MAVEACEVGVHVFEVGEVDVDEAFEGAEGVDGFVAAAVVDHCGVEAALVDGLEEFGDAVGIVGGGDETEEGR